MFFELHVCLQVEDGDPRVLILRLAIDEVRLGIEIKLCVTYSGLEGLYPSESVPSSISFSEASTSESGMATARIEVKDRLTWGVIRDAPGVPGGSLDGVAGKRFALLLIAMPGRIVRLKSLFGAFVTDKRTSRARRSLSSRR